MPRLFLLFVPALVAMSAPSAQASQTAEAVARAFCAAVRGSDEPAAEALMTPALQAAIARLRAADADYRALFPQDKPPLGDGLRLTAYPDGVLDCRPDAATPDSIDLVYTPGIDPSATWRDRLVLTISPDGAVQVAEILYAPDQTRRFTDWLEEAASWQ